MYLKCKIFEESRRWNEPYLTDFLQGSYELIFITKRGVTKPYLEISLNNRETNSPEPQIEFRDLSQRSNRNTCLSSSRNHSMGPGLDVLLFYALLLYVGPVIWDFLCGLVRIRFLGFLLIFIPYLVLGVLWPRMLTLEAIPYPFIFYIISTFIGYIVSLLRTRRKKQLEWNEVAD